MASAGANGGVPAPESVPPIIDPDAPPPPPNPVPQDEDDDWEMPPPVREPGRPGVPERVLR